MLVPVSRAYSVERPRSGRRGTERHEFDGPVQEQPAGVTMTPGTNFRLDGLRVVIFEQGPHQGGRPRRPREKGLRSQVVRDQYLRDKPAEPEGIDFADVRSHLRAHTTGRRRMTSERPRPG